MMLRKDSIATVFVALSLVVGAAACEEDRNIPRESCEYFQECEPVEFAQEYGSMSECEGVVRAQLLAIRDMYGAACHSAYYDFFSCAAATECQEDPEQVCAADLYEVDQACQETVTDPCPGYVAGSEDDFCCQTHDPCDWAGDQVCDCAGSCSWDAVDCTPN